MNILDSFFPRPAYRPEAALYFVHVPKCAGTSVRLMVENAFDGTRTYPCGSRLFTGNYIEIEDHLEAKEDLRGFQILTSHSGALLLPSLAPDVNLFTWLRHPRDRAISYFFFYYLEGIWPDSRKKDFRTRVNAGERLETVFMDSLRLYPPGYCPYIKEAVGLRPHTEIYWSQMYPDRDPHEFMQELLRRYFFVGLMEDHERSIDLFCALTGILPPRRQIRRNVGTKRPQALNFTPAEEEEFNEYLRGDIELYELAANIYHRQWDELVQWKDTNPALGFIGDREGLRACLLERSVRKGKIPGLGRWRAWDAVWGENR